MKTTVGKLKKLIASLPDDMPVVVTAPDHEYRPASARDVSALSADGESDFTEWRLNRDPTDEERSLWGSPCRVLVID